MSKDTRYDTGRIYTAGGTRLPFPFRYEVMPFLLVVTIVCVYLSIKILSPVMDWLNIRDYYLILAVLSALLGGSIALVGCIMMERRHEDYPAAVYWATHPRSTRDMFELEPGMVASPEQISSYERLVFAMPLFVLAALVAAIICACLATPWPVAVIVPIVVIVSIRTLYQNHARRPNS